MSQVKSKTYNLAAGWKKWDWWRIASIVLCVLGILVAGYLSWSDLTGTKTVCADTGKINCEVVQNSAYSKTVGFPIALLGMLGYVAILGVLVLEGWLQIVATYGRTLAVGFALFGVIFSAYLSYLEGSVLNAWCEWCVMSAILITALLVTTTYRLYLFIMPLRK